MGRSGKPRPEVANQLQARHSLHARVADQEVAPVERESQLDGGKRVVSMEDGVSVPPERLHHEVDDRRVLVRSNDTRPVEERRPYRPMVKVFTRGDLHCNGGGWSQG